MYATTMLLDIFLTTINSVLVIQLDEIHIAHNSNITQTEQSDQGSCVVHSDRLVPRIRQREMADRKIQSQNRHLRGSEKKMSRRQTSTNEAVENLDLQNAACSPLRIASRGSVA